MTVVDRMVEHNRALVRVATSEAMAQGDVQRVAQHVAEVACEQLGVARVTVWFFVEDGRRLRCVAAAGERRPSGESDLFLEAASYPAYFEALRKGRMVVADDAMTDRRTSELVQDYLEPHHIVSMLDAAVRVRGEVVGAVCHEHTGDRRAWQPDETAFACALADQIAQARVNAERAAMSESHRLLEDELEVTRRHEALGRLAGGVVHDLNNLLFVVLANAGLLAESADVGQRAELLGVLTGAAERCAELVRRLLTFGNRSLGVGSCDATRALAELGPLLSQVVPPGVQVVAQAPEVPCHVAAPRGALDQVLLNLVINARDAVGEEGRIDVGLAVVDAAGDDAPIVLPAARLSVRDDGPGIPDDVAQWMFQPFFSTKPAGQGTGLGLSTVKGLVEGTGGVVQVDSGPGGTEFAVWLPLADDFGTSTDVRVEPRLDPPSGSRGRAVVADSDREARQTLVALLQQQQFETLAVSTATEAVAVIASLEPKPDLLVVEQALIKGSDAVGSRGLVADVPTIVVDPALGSRTSHETLHKPFGGEALGRAIARALGGR